VRSESRLVVVDEGKSECALRIESIATRGLTPGDSQSANTIRYSYRVDPPGGP